MGLLPIVILHRLIPFNYDLVTAIVIALIFIGAIVYLLNYGTPRNSENYEDDHPPLKQ